MTIAYDSTNPLPPMFYYLKPYFNNPNKSYFRQLADGPAGAATSLHTTASTKRLTTGHSGELGQVIRMKLGGSGDMRWAKKPSSGLGRKPVLW